MKIDAVITWVNGNDPALNAKRNLYLAPEDRYDDIAGDTRYADFGEIFFCVASLNRFAPFINKIYIVTDGQDPHLDPFLEKNFPLTHIPYELVDHKTIFKSYEEYLPVFNSLSIETMLARIPGLNEHFIYFNDDYLLYSKVEEGDFFTSDGFPVLYARKLSALSSYLSTRFSRRESGRRRVTFKTLMWNAAKLYGPVPYMLRVNHTPKPLLKSWYESFYEKYPEAVIRNISHRFRSIEQFLVDECFMLDYYKNGSSKLKSYKKDLFFFQMKNKKMKNKRGYFDKKMSLLSGGKYKFACFNSLDKLSPEQRKICSDMLSERLDITMD